jgi:hypothetical protein
VYKIKNYNGLLSLLSDNLSDSLAHKQFIADILYAIRTGVLEEDIVESV